MSGQDAQFLNRIARRTVVKGLAVFPLAVSELGCASPAPPSSGASTPTAPLGSVIYTYRGHSQQVLAVAWSPDGRRLASASSDKSVQLCDASTGNHLSTYHRHTGEVTAVAWSPDSKYIASGSDDQTVQLWDASTGATRYTYRGYNVDQAHANPAKGVLPDIIYTVA